MAIYQYELSNASYRKQQRGYSSPSIGRPTAFLSHSHKDNQLALGLQQMLIEQGWDIYIDWQDQMMPERPDAETAKRIKNAIVHANWFLFLATENSMSSRWCPWEIGYADGKKHLNNIVIVPTVDSSGRHHGNEYLQIYSRIDTTSNGALSLYDLQGYSRGLRNI